MSSFFSIQLFLVFDLSSFFISEVLHYPVLIASFFLKTRPGSLLGARLFVFAKTPQARPSLRVLDAFL